MPCASCDSALDTYLVDGAWICPPCILAAWEKDRGELSLLRAEHEALQRAVAASMPQPGQRTTAEAFALRDDLADRDTEPPSTPAAQAGKEACLLQEQGRRRAGR